MSVTVAYEVRNRLSNERFYVLACSAEDAVERILSSVSLGGAEAWGAVPASLALTLVAGVVFDESGRPIKGPMS